MHLLVSFLMLIEAHMNGYQDSMLQNLRHARPEKGNGHCPVAELRQAVQYIELYCKEHTWLMRLWMTNNLTMTWQPALCLAQEQL